MQWMRKWFYSIWWCIPLNLTRSLISSVCFIWKEVFPKNIKIQCFKQFKSKNFKRNFPAKYYPAQLLEYSRFNWTWAKKCEWSKLWNKRERKFQSKSRLIICIERCWTRQIYGRAKRMKNRIYWRAFGTWITSNVVNFLAISVNEEKKTFVSIWLETEISQFNDQICCCRCFVFILVPTTLCACAATVRFGMLIKRSATGSL